MILPPGAENGRGQHHAVPCCLYHIRAQLAAVFRCCLLPGNGSVQVVLSSGCPVNLHRHGSKRPALAR